MSSAAPGTSGVPDPNGDVGPAHYVQMVNTLWAVYSKSGTLLGGPFPENSLWQLPTIPDTDRCKTAHRGDPIVLYDELADRWLLSFFAFTGTPGVAPFFECVAISKTGDPLGAWWLYSFNLSSVPAIGNSFPDYPKFGVWPDAYYMSANLFTATGQDSLYVAFNRQAMLNGAAANLFYYIDPTLNGNGLPADLDGDPPPVGSPGYFLEPDPGIFALRLYRFTVNWTVPNASVSAPVSIPVSSYDHIVCTFEEPVNDQCVHQPLTTVKLDPLDYDQLMFRLAYRNFGTHESLLASQTIDVANDPTQLAGRAGIRWYEVRSPRTTPVLYQQGTHAPDATTHRWLPAIAADKFGNIAVGYNVSDAATIFPGIRYAARGPADPLGQLPLTETTLIAGGGSKTGQTPAPDGRARWGDYSSMSVDPVDDCTFWFTGEYLAQTSPFAWNTRVGVFRLPQCGPSGPDADRTPPSAPQGLSRSGGSQTSISVVWGASSDDRGTAGYGLYVNGGSIGPTGATGYTFTGLNCGTPYTIEVDAFDAAGNRSGRASLATSTDSCQAAVRTVAMSLGGPRANFQRERTFQVTWRTVANSARYDIQYRAAKFRGIYGSWVSWRSNTPTTSTSFTGRAGSTYCFRVRANPQSGFVSDWSSARCTAVPVDDRSLRARGGWRLSRRPGRYLNTFAQSSRRGASLGLSGVRASRLALVATKCPRCGSVKVLWNGRLIANVRLTASSRLFKQIIEVGSFSSQQRGNLRIVVTSRRKPVAIEGLGVFS